ncbi:ATP-binding cassette domain-containing protein [Streptomyces winkii]|uniref:ATP-binding cassette domain-containing protein n=1 Tax=Streptomyces winkii TaxID=3051178 RepID=UPI0028D771E3|nr:ATP-binding cassette domain-containing protein [Streptomyces sp. DSM 40971]
MTGDGSAHDSGGTESTGPGAESGPETTAEEAATDSASEAAEAAEPARAGAGVRAEDFALDGPRGRVFAGVRFDAPPGSLVALEGPSGSGRTCLLLSLTGRMKATGGHAVVGGLRLPQQPAAVRRISALAAVPGVTDLEPSLSAAEHLRERVLLQRRFGGSLRALLRPRAERAAASRARIDAALAAAGLDLDALPKGPRTRVRDLERLEALRLSVALALLGEPRLLAVDDVDFKLSGREREQAWSLLRSVAASGVTVLAVCSEAPRGAVVVRTGTQATHQQPAETGESGVTSEKEAADALAETGRA